MITIPVFLDKSPETPIDKICLDINKLKQISKPHSKTQKILDEQALDNFLLDSGVNMEYKLELSTHTHKGNNYQCPSKITLITSYPTQTFWDILNEICQ